jgi:carbamoyltransferase
VPRRADQQTICGLKLTHDGGVAVIEGNRLLFSVEAEKVGNRERHAHLDDAADIARQLATNGIDAGDIDRVSVDGWVQSKDGSTAVNVINARGRPQSIPVAQYAHVGDDAPEPLAVLDGEGLPIGWSTVSYASHAHATGHVFASYCTSPFAREERPALVVVWDGGMPVCLYAFDPRTRTLRSHGTILPISGALYPVFAAHFEPFRVGADRRRARGSRGDFSQLEALLPISGKAMAYAALDKPVEEAIDVMEEVTERLLPIGTTGSYMWSHQVRERLEGLQLGTAAVLASFQEHLFRLLRGALQSALPSLPDDEWPLCLSGGCALNIKWNAGLRESGLFADVWVPPFPNDSGSAIGAACAEMVRTTGQTALDWSVFSGPDASFGTPPPGWTWRDCPIEGVAAVLQKRGAPVVLVTGPAELGPRALGHRSIIAPAVDRGTHDVLNGMKRRESYRPVAPICLEERAPEIFDPGTPDPFMLFDHAVRADWARRIPAVVHVDGSARLQTVGPDNVVLHRLLRAYDRLSGIPVLCNTSANLPGRGFFPDASSAMAWGECDYVWSNDRLYTRTATG